VNGYAGLSGADVFEVWADVARHYRLDPRWTVTTGYSMGGLGTFKFAQMFPDLFAKAQPTVGSESETYREASLRNVPVLMWNVSTDELVGPQSYLPTAQKLDELGYDYELDVFFGGEHLSLAINDQFAPAAKFLGTTRVDRNPAHVTYVADPAVDEPEFGLRARHAYWLSGVRTRDRSTHGTIDAVSRGFGRGDAAAGPAQHGPGALMGGAYLDPYPFTRQWRSPAKKPPRPARNRLQIRAENIAGAVVDVRRAQLSCGATVDIETDGPTAIRLAGCRRTVRAG
jgi:pimeloyl-ACP methyl ester carboxylesterase